MFLVARHLISVGICPVTRSRPRSGSLLGHVVNKVVHMQDVSARKDAGNAGLEALVDHRSAGDARKFDAGGTGEFVLGKEPHREKQRVAGIALLGAGDWPALLVHLGNPDRLDALLSLHARNRVREQERDAKVIQALDDVSLEAARVGHEFRHARNVCSLERHPTGHDEANVTGAQDHDLASRHEALDVNQALGGARSVDARRPEPRDDERSPRPLAAAHGENDGACRDTLHAAVLAHARDDAVRRDVQHHGIEKELHARVTCEHLKAIGSELCLL